MEINWLQIIVSFLFGQAVLAVFPVARRILVEFWSTIFFFVPAVNKYRRVMRYVRSDDQFWAINPPTNKASSVPIPNSIAFMNFKGGVGKTTLAANCIAAWATKRDMRILAFDLDYQGSLTSLLKPPNNEATRPNDMAGWIQPLDQKKSWDDLVQNASTRFPNVDIVSADYELSDIEEKELIRWLVDGKTIDDIRYRVLTRLNELNSSDKYDLIVFDAPPRLSVSAVNGLVATKSIIVPAQLQELATRPLSKMVQRLGELRDAINARYRIAGAVCNKTHGFEGLTQPERTQMENLRNGIAAASSWSGVEGPRLENDIPVNVKFVPAIGRPEDAPVAFLSELKECEAARIYFERLSDEILRRARLISQSNRPSINLRRGA